MAEKAEYFISETGLLARNNAGRFEVFMLGEWSAPEAETGDLKGFDILAIHTAMLLALKEVYNRAP
jgi:hypothetical protein